MTTTVLNIKLSEVENKIPYTSGLVTTTLLNTKISEVENKISSVSGTKIKKNEGKYFTTAGYNKFTTDILYVKIKQKDLVNKSNIDKKVININNKITSNKAKHIVCKKLTDLTKTIAQTSEKEYDFC